MKEYLVPAMTILFFIAFSSFVKTDNHGRLPTWGEINFYTGGHGNDAVVVNAVDDDHLQRISTLIGMAYNKACLDPLHGGPVNCFYSFDLIDGVGKVQGYCD